MTWEERRHEYLTRAGRVGDEPKPERRRDAWWSAREPEPETERVLTVHRLYPMIGFDCKEGA